MTIQTAAAASRGIEFTAKLSTDEYEALVFLLEQQRQEYDSQGGFRGAVTFSTVVGQSLVRSAMAAGWRKPAQPQQSRAVQPPPPRMPEPPTPKTRNEVESSSVENDGPYVLLKPRPEDYESKARSSERAIRYGRRPSLSEVYVQARLSDDLRR